MSERIELSAEIPVELSGQRLDQIAAKLFPEYSRARLQQWIKEGSLLVDGKRAKPKDKHWDGERIEVNAEPVIDERWEAQDIELDIVYEDDHLLVINKPAGLVVHPAAGHASGTLLNALLNHSAQMGALPRAGIVHRLDKDTSGLMVVAKSLIAHRDLVEQLQARDVHREYEAITHGSMTGGGTVDAPLGRHPTQRTKMAVVQEGGKEAITHYRLIRRFSHHTHVRCLLETGRTHQIRVHMAHIRYPLVGDPLYANRTLLPRGASQELIDGLRGFPRQALHARRLELYHPETGELMSWEVPLAEDMVQLLELLEREESLQ